VRQRDESPRGTKHAERKSLTGGKKRGVQKKETAHKLKRVACGRKSVTQPDSHRISGRENCLVGPFIKTTKEKIKGTSRRKKSATQAKKSETKAQNGQLNNQHLVISGGKGIARKTHNQEGPKKKTGVAVKAKTQVARYSQDRNPSRVEENKPFST